MSARRRRRAASLGALLVASAVATQYSGCACDGGIFGSDDGWASGGTSSGSGSDDGWSSSGVGFSPPSPVPCSTHGDCAFDQHCDPDRAVCLNGCLDETSCPEGYHCAAVSPGGSHCVPCVTDSDCAGACNQGDQCAAKCGDGVSCATPAQCMNFQCRRSCMGRPCPALDTSGFLQATRWAADPDCCAADTGSCGIDVGFVDELWGTGPPAQSCQPREQPGMPTYDCPDLVLPNARSFQAGWTRVTPERVRFDGCCRPDATCGVWFDRMWGCPMGYNCVLTDMPIVSGAPTGCVSAATLGLGDDLYEFPLPATCGAAPETPDGGGEAGAWREGGATDARAEGGSPYCASDVQVDSFSAGMSKTGARGTVVTLAGSVPTPPGIAENTWTLSLADAGGAAIVGATVVVELLMAAHGHGTNVEPVVQDLGGGNYEVSRIAFIMPGVWQSTIDLGMADGGTDSVLFTFCID